MRKKDLVAGLVSKYVDPDSRRGLSALGALPSHKVTATLGAAGPTPGSYAFQAYDLAGGDERRASRRVSPDRGGRRRRDGGGRQAARAEARRRLAVPRATRS